MRSVTGYSPSQIRLHWLIAAMILFMLLPVSRDGVLLPESDGALGMPMTLHIWVGLALAPLTCVRLLLRVRRGVPDTMALEPVLLRGGGRLAHGTMYLLMLVLVASGAGQWWLGLPLAHLVHEVARILLTSIVGLHVAAALTHHFVLRDRALARMLTPAQRVVRRGWIGLRSNGPRGPGNEARR